MELNPLTAISPIDGRYRSKTQELSNYFSEFAFFQYRIQIEIEYFIVLCKLPLPQLKSFKKNSFIHLRLIYEKFSLQDAETIKELEKITNHDIKAVEYFIKEKFDKLNLSPFKEFVHFGLTSQDINNTAVPLLFQNSIKQVYLPLIKEIIGKIDDLAETCRNIPMLARTHGQPASPTRMDKELQVFTERLKKQLILFKKIPYSAKFGGATGNFNAHHVAYPQIDWDKFADNFVNDVLGLTRSHFTTQIEHYDNFAAQCDNLKRINTILIDFVRDIWLYISFDYFRQSVKSNEVGSSAMPHKINPIDFENAEGNLGMANACFEHLSNKLPVSRLQRDLTDSTVLRNIGIPIGHTVVAFKSVLSGLSKLSVNKDAVLKDLENNWVVIAEAIQTILRREGYSQPYEALKMLTRSNRKITRNDFTKFIDKLDVNKKIKNELKKISPFNYTGI